MSADMSSDQYACKLSSDCNHAFIECEAEINAKEVASSSENY
jgi:hypothetical protein